MNGMNEWISRTSPKKKWNETKCNSKRMQSENLQTLLGRFFFFLFLVLCMEELSFTFNKHLFFFFDTLFHFFFLIILINYYVYTKTTTKLKKKNNKIFYAHAPFFFSVLLFCMKSIFPKLWANFCCWSFNF